MLQAGLPIFFGSDVGKFSSSTSGIMDLSLIDYELGFNVKLGMSKAQRLMTGESAMTHAMVLTAVHIENGKSIRWRVQNSWGTNAGSEGWFVMSDAWMDEFGKFSISLFAIVGVGETWPPWFWAGDLLIFFVI